VPFRGFCFDTLVFRFLGPHSAFVAGTGHRGHRWALYRSCISRPVASIHKSISGVLALGWRLCAGGEHGVGNRVALPCAPCVGGGGCLVVFHALEVATLCSCARCFGTLLLFC